MTRPVRLAALAAAVAAFTACGGSPARPAQALSELPITAAVAGAPSVATLVIEVSAADVQPTLVFNLAIAGGVASGTLRIPPGAGRVLVARAYDASGDVTHDGSATVDVVRGTNPPVRIPMVPRTSGVPVQVDIGPVVVAVAPTTAALLPGETVQLSAAVHVAGGDALPGAAVEWATTDPGVAVVDAAGLVTAVGGGAASVVATFAGTSGRCDVSVAGGAGGPMTVALLHDADGVGFGNPVHLTASVANATGPVTLAWSSTAAPAALQISAAGDAATLTMPSLPDALAAAGQPLPGRPGVVPVTGDARGAVTVSVVATSALATGSASVTLRAAAPSLGLPDVAVGERVYLTAGGAAPGAWSLAPPPGSGAALDAPGAAFPSFVPDVAGTYVASAGAVAVTVHAGARSGVIFTCAQCHDGIIAADAITPWSASRHAASGVDCDGCHGPTASDAHPPPSGFDPATYALRSPRVGYAAELCGTCHASGPGDPAYAQWLDVGATAPSHASRANALATAAVGGATVNASCSRCHAAQTYVEWLKLLRTGVIATIPSSTLAAIDPSAIEPIGCVACHDPHGGGNPSALRVYDATPLLPSGFAVAGLGKGALCATCHNTRNGMQTGSTTATYLHEDGEPYNSGNPTGYSAPHDSAQADVYAGRNAYFMGASLPMTSQHLAVADGCAGCHMALNPAARAPGATGHVFRIAPADEQALCAGCHGAATSPAGLQATLASRLDALASKLGGAVVARANATPRVSVTAWDPATDLYTAPDAVQLDTAAMPIVSAQPLVIHGQCGFMLQLATPVTVQLVDAARNPVGGPRAMTSFGVQLGSLKDASTTPRAIYALGGNLVRACWNLFLLQADGSLGLHNPSFATAVVNATAAKDLSN